MHDDLRAHAEAALAAEYDRQAQLRAAGSRGEKIAFLDRDGREIKRGYIAISTTGRHILLPPRNSRQGYAVGDHTFAVVTEKGDLIWARLTAIAELAGPREAAWSEVDGRAAIFKNLDAHVYRFISRGSRYDAQDWNAVRVGECAGDCGYHCGPRHGGEPCSHCPDGTTTALFGYERYVAGDITLLPEDEVEAKVAELARTREEARRREAAARVRERAAAAEREAIRSARYAAYEARLDAIEQDARQAAGPDAEPKNLAALRREIGPGAQIEVLALPRESSYVGTVHTVEKVASSYFELGGSHFRWPKAGELSFIGDTFIIRDERGYGRAYRIRDDL